MSDSISDLEPKPNLPHEVKILQQTLEHHILNINSGITGYTDLLLIDERLPESLKPLVQKIYDASLKLTQVTKTIGQIKRFDKTQTVEGADIIWIEDLEGAI